MKASAQVRLGADIRRRRSEQGLTIELLAMRADISTQHLRRIEKGLADVGLPVLTRIAAALGVSIGVLFGGVPKLSPKALACGRIFDAVDEGLREAVLVFLRAVVRRARHKETATRPIRKR